jgi:hypothetical protein
METRRDLQVQDSAESKVENFSTGLNDNFSTTNGGKTWRFKHNIQVTQRPLTLWEKSFKSSTSFPFSGDFSPCVHDSQIAHSISIPPTHKNSYEMAGFYPAPSATEVREFCLATGELQTRTPTRFGHLSSLLAAPFWSTSSVSMHLIIFYADIPGETSA